jgi:hypothetical protein
MKKIDSFASAGNVAEPKPAMMMVSQAEAPFARIMGLQVGANSLFALQMQQQQLQQQQQQRMYTNNAHLYSMGQGYGRSETTMTNSRMSNTTGYAHGFRSSSAYSSPSSGAGTSYMGATATTGRATTPTGPTRSVPMTKTMANTTLNFNSTTSSGF